MPTGDTLRPGVIVHDPNLLRVGDVYGSTTRAADVKGTGTTKIDPKKAGNQSS